MLDFRRCLSHSHLAQFSVIQAKLMSVPESVPEYFIFEMSQVGGLTAVMVMKRIDVSPRHCGAGSRFPEAGPYRWHAQRRRRETSLPRCSRNIGTGRPYR